MRPNRSSAVATSASWSSQLVTSQRTASAFSSPPSSSARALSLSSDRAASTTRWPNSTARRAVAAPMPVLAPVITRTGSSGMWEVLPHRLGRPVAAPHPTEARFPAVPVEAGHYESFYLKACHPAGGPGVWSRSTVHQRPGALPNGSLWVTLFDASGEGPRAHKETKPGPVAGADWIAIGDAAMREGAAAGSIDGADWDLRFASSEQPLFH